MPVLNVPEVFKILRWMEIGQPEIFSEKMKKCQNPCKIKAFSTSLPVCGRIRTADPSLRSSSHLSSHMLPDVNQSQYLSGK